ncbi:MAG: hypothetical protein WAL04_12705 [Acidimicrobiales bacterium]
MAPRLDGGQVAAVIGRRHRITLGEWDPSLDLTTYYVAKPVAQR